MKLYFAYGSNLHKTQMRYRCPDSIPVTKAYLSGYKLVFRGVADIVSEEGATVEGAIYLVSKRDERNLDRYEGYPHLYTKEGVLVVGEDGNCYEAFVYTMVNKNRIAPPDPHYLWTINQGCFHWGLSLVKV